jgi:hypothetical protein
VQAAELQLVAVSGAQVELADLGRGFEMAVDDHIAVAILEVGLSAPGRSHHRVRIRRGAHGQEPGAEAGHLVVAKHPVDLAAELLTRLENVIDIKRAKRHHAADRTGAVGVDDGTAHHIGAREQLGLEINETIGLVAGALEVLPRPVDQHCDPTEILQAADVDRDARIVGALLEIGPWYTKEQVLGAAGQQLIDLIAAHRADAGKRLRDRFLDFRGHDRDRVEQRRLLRSGWRHQPCRHPDARDCDA